MMPDDTIDEGEEEAAEAEQAEEAEGARRESQGPALPRRHRHETAKGLILEGVVSRAQRAPAKLRTNLTGDILVEVDGSNERYLFDWTSDEPRSTQTDQVDASCVIRLSEDNLLKVASGDLNPQVAMLCDKIRVRGKQGLAIYFFNLVAPIPQ